MRWDRNRGAGFSRLLLDSWIGQNLVGPEKAGMLAVSCGIWLLPCCAGSVELSSVSWSWPGVGKAEDKIKFRKKIIFSLGSGD